MIFLKIPEENRDSPKSEGLRADFKLNLTRRRLRILKPANASEISGWKQMFASKVYGAPVSIGETIPVPDQSKIYRAS